MPDPSPQASALIELRHELDVALAERDRPGAVTSALAAVQTGAVGIVALYTVRTDWPADVLDLAALGLSPGPTGTPDGGAR